MADLRDGFRHFFTPDQEQEEELIRTGLISVDTNVLLDLYKYSPKALDQFFAAAENLREKIWIPHQVALEFHRRREKTLGEVVGGVKKIENKWNSVKATINELSAATNSPLDTDELRKLLEQVDTAFTNELTSQREHFDSWKSNDPIFPRLEQCIEVGPAPDDQWIETAIAEAKRRLENEIPPGYLDASKDKDKAPKFYWNGNKIPRKYGDVFLWLQLLERTRKRAQDTPNSDNKVIFVSNDQKPDWTRKGSDGQTYGPRRELIDEMLTKGQCTDFWIYPLNRYLDIAGSVFKLDTKDAVTEAEEIKDAHHQESMHARWRTLRYISPKDRKVDRNSPEIREDDPDVLEVWAAWKDTIGQPGLVLTLRKRNYLRSLISRHRAGLVCHAIRAWTEGWFEYDSEDFITEDSATHVWKCLDEIIETKGAGRPPIPGFPELDEDLGIDGIPF